MAIESFLLVAPTMPARTGNGLAMRVGMFLEALTKLGATDLAVLPVSPLADMTPILPQLLGVRTTIIATASRRDTQYELIARLTDPDARLAAFRQYGRPSLAAAVSAAVLGEVKTLVDQRDYRLVHVARSYLSGIAPAVPPGVLRSIDLDEDEATSSREMAQQCHQGGETGRARWLEAEADNFDALTRVLPRRFDRFFISSSQDSDKLVSRHPGLRPEVVENAVVIPKTPPRRDDGRTIVFVGSFGYGPNVAACLWFAQQVWPIVRAAAPTGRVRLIGRDPPRTILELARIDGIQVVGPVDDVADAYTGATLAIAPLHAGTGTRIKIIEAAAFEVPIVSTSLAACGLRLEAPEALWIGDDAAAFAAAVVNALANPEERQRRAKVALRVVQTHHDRAKVIAGLADRFREMLAD